MTTLLHKTSTAILLTITSLVGGNLLVGCDKQPNDDKTPESDTAKVNIPKTAPLIAGESVSAALSRAVPVQSQNRTEDETQASIQTESGDNTTQKIATPTVTPRTTPNNAADQSAQKQSIVTNTTQKGTPEFVLKQALNTIYFGDAKKAGQYFQNNTPSLQQALQQTQPDFRKAIESISFAKTSYNANKTAAKIDSTLKFKGVAAPQPRSYDMVKTNGQWKIIAQ